MEHVWSVVEDLRGKYEILREDRIPIDVFTFLEIELGLDPIPFENLASKYRVDAAIKADFSGIYLDEEQYRLMEKGPEWKLNRLRFTVAHELAHYFLHRDIPPSENFESLSAFATWTENLGGRKYVIEQEANEFAGRLLVPLARIQDFYDEFAPQMMELMPNFVQTMAVRDNFCERCCGHFGVNWQVIAVRLDREGIWPAI